MYHKLAPDDSKIEVVQQKLAAYRSQKERKVKIKNIGNVISKFLNYISSLLTSATVSVPQITPWIEPKATQNNEKNEEKSSLWKRNMDSEAPLIHETNDEAEEYISDSGLFTKWTLLDWVILSLKISLWLIVWKIFIVIEFGAVYFVVSCFLFIWYSLYSGKKRKGLSAYSVFNPNCEQIEGTFTAEKFEKELLHRM